MDNYTRLVEVQVRLSGKTSFPVTDYRGPPEKVEQEIEQFCRDVLEPGYPHYANPEKRLPLVRIFSAAVGTRSAAQFCVLNILKGENGSIFNFIDRADRRLLHQVKLPDEKFLVASQAYHDVLTQAEERVKAILAKVSPAELQRIKTEYDRLSQGDRPAEFTAFLLDEKNADGVDAIFAPHNLDIERRETHNLASDYMLKAFRDGGVAISNPTLTNDLAMRLFALNNFLMHDPSKVLPAAADDFLSRRKPGQYRTVHITACPAPP